MHPDKASKAAVAGRKTWDYLSKGQRKAIMDQLEVEANKGAELMPLLHPEIQTVANEKEIVEDFADKPHLKAASAKIAEVYGVKPAEAMTKAQGVRTAENNGLGTKAEILEGAHRDPTALPFDIKNSKPRYGDYKIDFKDPRDLALYTVGQATKNKAHDRFMAYLLKQFPDKSEAELQAMGREVKARIQREIPNTEGDTIKLSAKEAPQPRIATKAAEDYEPEEGAFARIGVPENISYMKNYKITNIKPAALVSPKLPVEEFLKGTLQFLPETPATKSGKIYFENPEHQLLWLAHESEAPLSVRTRAATILRYQFGGKNQYLKVLQQQRASWLAHHIEMLVASGHLQGEGNVFRSTKLGPSMYGTKAQKMVPEEVSDEERALIIAEKLPKAIQNTLVDANETMTKLSNKVKDPSKARARRAGAKKIVDIAQEVN
jgi:hypothetical protein